MNLFAGIFGNRFSFLKAGTGANARFAGGERVLQRGSRGYPVLLPGVLLVDADNGLRRVADPSSCHVGTACLRGGTVAEVRSLLHLDLDGALSLRSSSYRHGLCL